MTGVTGHHAIAKDWRRLSAKRLPGHRRRLWGMTGTRPTLAAIPATAVGNAVLDVVLKDGFRPR
jgi:hypothetical protein